MKPNIKDQITEDLFEDELDFEEDARMGIGGGDTLQKRTPGERIRFNTNPSFQSFENQDEMDAELALELRKMQEDAFGRSRSSDMETGQSRNPFLSDPIEYPDYDMGIQFEEELDAIDEELENENFEDQSLPENIESDYSTIERQEVGLDKIEDVWNVDESRQEEDDEEEQIRY